VLHIQKVVLQVKIYIATTKNRIFLANIIHPLTMIGSFHKPVITNLLAFQFEQV